MALNINNPINGISLCNNKPTSIHHQRHLLPSLLSLSSTSSSLSSRTSLIVVAAAGKFTSKTGKFDSKNKRTSTITTKEEEEQQQQKKKFVNYGDVIDDDVKFDDSYDDGFVVPQLPGEQPDFWEGPQWDALGFFVQYLWAFGVVFSLIACGVAVATYNEGATDFRKTPAYKESIQSGDLLEGPEGSDADVFESNPTEEAPALD